MRMHVNLPPGNAWLPLAVRHASRRGLTRLRIVAGTVIIIGALSVRSGVSPATGITDASDVWVGGVAIVIGVLWLWLAWRAPGRAVKLQPRYMLTEPGLIEITDAGVTQIYPSARIEFAWSAFVRTVETPQMWLLYTGRISVIYVPKEPLTGSERSELADRIGRTGIPATTR